MPGAGEEDDKKPEQNEHIVLNVKNQYGYEVFFKIKRGTQLKKLMTLYCDRQSVDSNSVRFMFDGRTLYGEQTPEELNMEDGDEIDVYIIQRGC